MARAALVICTGLAVCLSAAALIVALRTPQHTHPEQAATHGQLCALLGAIMDDNDQPVGLFASAARLYAEDRC